MSAEYDVANIDSDAQMILLCRRTITTPVHLCIMWTLWMSCVCALCAALYGVFFSMLVIIDYYDLNPDRGVYILVLIIGGVFIELTFIPRGRLITSIARVASWSLSAFIVIIQISIILLTAFMVICAFLILLNFMRILVLFTSEKYNTGWNIGAPIPTSPSGYNAVSTNDN